MHMLSDRPVLPLVLLAFSAVHAAADERLPVDDPRVLLRAALSAPDGQAQGILHGEAAMAIRQRFSATSPVYLDVRTLHRYRQHGCARLNMRAWQEGVLLPGADARRTERLDIGIDYCLDGRPPRSREEP